MNDVHKNGEFSITMIEQKENLSCAKIDVPKGYDDLKKCCHNAHHNFNNDKNVKTIKKFSDDTNITDTNKIVNRTLNKHCVSPNNVLLNNGENDILMAKNDTSNTSHVFTENNEQANNVDSINNGNNHDTGDNFTLDGINGNTNSNVGHVTNTVLHLDADEIVISGISGRYPQCDNLEELKNKLYAGMDMVNDVYTRWPKGIYGVPERMGTIRDISKFDTEFFNINPKQADVMDPQARLLLEVAYEAIIDSGMSPVEVKGSQTGVFNGSVYSETDYYLNGDAENVNGYALTGCAQATYPNRVSFAFDFKGPSYSINTMCSSSMFALQQAVMAMRTGQCDAAIVSGTNMCIRPETSLCLRRLQMISQDGTCRSFDAAGSGYARSEGVVALFLQRKSVARRHYATIVHSKTNNDGTKVEGFPCVNSASQKRLLLATYGEAGITPTDLEYFEAHGTGTKVGDPHELNAIADVVCNNRALPLLIGSVKTNIGHTEATAGLCSITKVILAMETGVIPANLHFKTPNPNIPALFDGSLKVVTENTQYKGGLVAVNSFGVGGTNAHTILKQNSKVKQPMKYNYCIPRLVTFSGRTLDAVEIMLKSIQKEKNDSEFLALVDNVHKYNIPGHNYRGYCVLSETPVTDVMETPNASRPVWFVFSGMGAQWPGMAKDLIKFPIFCKTIEKCALSLKEYNFDLVDVLVNGTEETFQNVTNSFVAITATQVALVDLLASLGIRPDGMVGHSIGELGCAYADETITAIQAVQAAYWRGQCIIKSNLPKGSMASVGLSWEKLVTVLPPEIHAACQNSLENTTVSGPPEGISSLVRRLQNDNIFARIVNSSGVAFHSKYIATVGDMLLPILQDIIPEPKRRTSRWISTSIPESKWNTPNAKYSSAEYHVNNLLSPVLFHSAISLVPDNSIVIEIAPHSLLRAILKRSIGSNCIYMGLLDKTNNNNAELLLHNIGKLYNAGLQPQVAQLYRAVKFPVSRGTPSLGSLVRWDHSQSWAAVSLFSNDLKTGQNVIKVNLGNDKDNYLSGHIIDGKILFPAAGYLSLVWRTFANKHGKDVNEMPVILENIKFHRATVLTNNTEVKFSINIMVLTGMYEIYENGDIVSSGIIKYPQNIDMEYLDIMTKNFRKDEKENDAILSVDIYKYLRSRGYEFSQQFCGIVSSNSNGTNGHLNWSGNWVTFIESMCAFSMFGDETNDLYIPTSIKKVVINPQCHLMSLNNKQQGNCIEVFRDKEENVIRSGAIEVRGLQTNFVPSKRQMLSAATLLKFVPYDNKTCIDNTDASSDQLQMQPEKDILMNLSKGGIWGSYKCINREENETIQVHNAYVGPLIRGNLSTLKWISTTETPAISSVTHNLTGLYSCINIRDLLIASGKYPLEKLHPDVPGKNCQLGVEFAAMYSDGRRMMGLTPAGSLTTHVLANEFLNWDVPDKWSLSQGATIPLSYVIAYYLLYIKGSLREGDNLLIQDGAKPVGQAAIALALNMKCVIFTTAANHAEKSFLHERFPQLNDEYIVHTDCIQKIISKVTRGQGVNVVFDANDGYQHDCFKCLAAGGTILHFSCSRDDTFCATLPINVSYIGITMNNIFNMNCYEKKLLFTLMKDGISKGIVTPLPFIQFSNHELQSAFRHLKSNGTEKIAIEIIKEQVVACSTPKIPAIRRICTRSDKSYILLDGVNEFGMAMSDWLIATGSKCIIFTSDTMELSGLESLQINRWKSQGIAVHILNINMSQLITHEACSQLIGDVTKIAPVAGIFNLSHLYQAKPNKSDSDLEVITMKNFDIVCNEMHIELNYFVYFSSLSSRRRNANVIYNINVAIENLMENRKNQGLPGLVIQWGPVENIPNTEMQSMDTVQPQSITSCIQTLERVLNLDHPVVASIQFCDNKIERSADNNKSEEMIQHVANILGIKDATRCPPSSSLIDLGMDSLMEPEIRTILESKYNLKFNVKEIRGLTFSKLQLLGDSTTI